MFPAAPPSVGRAERDDATDEQLMARFQRGDRSAIGALVRRHQERVYNFALRQVGSSAAAEDIVERGFVRVVQRAAEFGRGGRFATWLYAIVRDLCVERLRVGPPPAGAPSDGDMRDRVLAAIGGLPDPQREVLLLREIAALPVSEIAAVVGAPEDRVKALLLEALDGLQALLAELPQPHDSTLAGR